MGKGLSLASSNVWATLMCAVVGDTSAEPHVRTQMLTMLLDAEPLSRIQMLTMLLDALSRYGILSC